MNNPHTHTWAEQPSHSRAQPPPAVPLHLLYPPRTPVTAAQPRAARWHPQVRCLRELCCSLEVGSLPQLSAAPLPSLALLADAFRMASRAAAWEPSSAWLDAAAHAAGEALASPGGQRSGNVWDAGSGNGSNSVGDDAGDSGDDELRPSVLSALLHGLSHIGAADMLSSAWIECFDAAAEARQGSFTTQQTATLLVAYAQLSGVAAAADAAAAATPLSGGSASRSKKALRGSAAQGRLSALESLLAPGRFPSSGPSRADGGPDGGNDAGAGGGTDGGGGVFGDGRMFGGGGAASAASGGSIGSPYGADSASVTQAWTAQGSAGFDAPPEGGPHDTVTAVPPPQPLLTGRAGSRLESLSCALDEAMAVAEYAYMPHAAVAQTQQKA
uniref:Uncharacterized protein n=1 Tax=Chlamydomonas euryale TaxID=1486919 RepID=A0A7R9VH28_9CHLO